MEYLHGQADLDSIGARIKSARTELGLNQSELAKRVGVSQPAVANWESGVHDPRRIILAKLSAALGVSIDWLAGGKRSAMEADKHAAAAYLRRTVHHAPVITLDDAARFLRNPDLDPHIFAEDYLAVMTRNDSLFVIIMTDDSMRPVFPAGTLVLVDYGDRNPLDGSYCLAMTVDGPAVRIWRSDPPRLQYYADWETRIDQACASAEPVIGCVSISVQMF